MRLTNRLLFALGLCACIAAGYFIYTSAQRGAVACTQEARLCPDGSYVGRSGPACTFAECPTVTQHADWQSASTAELAFQYPARVGVGSFVQPAAPDGWPPRVSLAQGTFACEASTGSTRTLSTIAGHQYCVERLSEGAAGSTYTTYTYSFPRDAGVVSLVFTIRAVQCLNYDEPQQAACLAAQAAFSADGLADSIAQTVRFVAQPPVVPSI